MAEADAYPEMNEELDDSVVDNNKPVISEAKDWTVSALRDKYAKGKIDLQPVYQRGYVWQQKPELPSRLIESLLLHIPVPPIYFGKSTNGKLEVIDGQQRLTTIIQFVSNGFPLQRLGRLKDLNGKYYKDLTEDSQSMIDDSSVRTIVIDTGSDPNLRYEIFERLNRGAVALNEQEIRNCIFHGPFCDLIAKLEVSKEWRDVRGSSVPEGRFKEREMILRFFSFYENIAKYGGNLKRFLNDYMGSKFEIERTNSNPTAYFGDLSKLEMMFQQTMRNVYIVFGPHSARLYTANLAGKWDSKFSISALDVQASALVGYLPSKVQQSADQIKEAYVFYLLTHPELQEAISRQPASKEATKTRWFGFRSEVQKILSGASIEPRFFSYEVRKALFEKSDVCSLCKGQIYTFDDSTVDHIFPYSKGGKTQLANAQIAHRICNSKKCANIPVALAHIDVDDNESYGL